MKPSELYEALHALISESVPIYIWGVCGVGSKPAILHRKLRELNGD